MASLSIRNVFKTFGREAVLKGINIDVGQGEFLVLVGPSGCGKSTLLNLIAGLEEITQGEISIGERNVNRVHPKDRNIAMVFQSYALYPSMTVRKNIAFGLEIRKVPKDRVERRVQDVATMLQIEHLLNRKPSQLSGGQRQRVAMGRALARDPDIFLFDEPLSNLDAKLRVEMRMEIKQMHLRVGKTVVYVTHDQVEAMTLAERIAVMKDGIVQQIADPQTVYDLPANMFVAGFIGSPAMNFVPGVLVRNGEGVALQVESPGDSPLLIPLHRSAAEHTDWLDRPVILGIRPEQLTHDGPRMDPGGSAYVFEGAVRMLEPTGPDTLVFTTLGNTPVMARVSPEAMRPVGQVMRFVANTDKSVLFDPETERRI